LNNKPKRIFHNRCNTQIGWHTGLGKKGFINMNGEPRRKGAPYICPNCGKIPPIETDMVLE